MNETQTHSNQTHIDETQTYLSLTMNDSQLPIYDHTDFMNETKSPKHIYYMNGTYTYISFYAYAQVYINKES